MPNTGSKSSITLFLLILLASSNVTAADCKGLSRSNCDAGDSCTWVPGFKKKDDSKVRSYCRSTDRSAHDKSQFTDERSKTESKAHYSVTKTRVESKPKFKAQARPKMKDSTEKKARKVKASNNKPRNQAY